MESNTAISTVSLPVASIEEEGGWFLGTVADDPTGSHPMAPHITLRGSIPYLLKHGNLAEAVAPVFLSFTGPTGIFRPVREEVLSDFLTIHEGQNDEARVFIRKHGVFSHEDLDPAKRRPPKVAAWWKAQGKSTVPFALRVSDFWTAYREVISGHKMWTAIYEGDERSSDSLRRSLGPDLVMDFSPRGSALEQSRFLLTLLVSRGLKTARFSPVENGGELVPGIVTSVVRDALYVGLMQRISRGEVLRKCKREGCNEYFVPGPRGKDYHQRSCMEAQKQKEYRARQKSTA